MSDAEPPAEVQGGPSWRRAAPAAAAPPAPTPASSASAPRSGLLDEGLLASGEDDLYHHRYARTAQSAYPYLIVAFVLMAAAWWAMDWSRVGPGATDPVRSSEWWTNITSVLLPGEGIRLASYSQARMWTALALLMAAAAAICLWIGRLGRNLRTDRQPFGSVLPLLAFPAWWLLPLTIGTAADAVPLTISTATDINRARGDLLVRFLIAFGVLFAQFLLLRWPLLNRIWRAGRLPYDVASVVLWLPMMIPWMMFLASNAYTYFTLDDKRSAVDSSWRPTLNMVDWARGTTRATAVATIVLLVIVTARQHSGVAKDRQEADARRERTRTEALPLLPPGA